MTLIIVGAGRSEYLLDDPYTDCCDDCVHRPKNSGRADKGNWFCRACGKTYRWTGDKLVATE
jgi:ribosomal protein L37AE/L43A